MKGTNKMKQQNNTPSKKAFGKLVNTMGLSKAETDVEAKPAEQTQETSIAPATETKEEANWWQDLEVVEHVEHYINQGHSANDSIKKVAKERDLNKKEVYRAYHID